MANPEAVRALLKDLKRVGSPVQRIKLLTLAWRTVRELSPAERSEIASELGMKELSGLMERLGRKKDGVAPAEVLQALEQVDELDPRKVSAVLRGLWSRGTRKEAVRDGLEMLGQILQKPETGTDEAVGEASQETESEVTGDQAAATEPGVEEAPTDSRVSAGTAAFVTAEAEPTAFEPDLPDAGIAAVPSPETVARPRVPGTGPGVVPDEELVPEVPSGAIPPPPPGPKPAAPLPEPASTLAAAGAPEPPLGEPQAPVPGRSRVAMLESTRSLSGRFRMVRELVGDGRGVDEESLEAIVEQFPDGWQRRRVLCLLFRNGLPASTTRALDLIDGLEGKVDRRWCAATLADARDLTPSEIDDLLRRFPFPGLARRLRPARRAG